MSRSERGVIPTLGACGKAPAAETKAPTEADVSVTEKVTETEAARPHFDKLTLEFVPSKDADVIIAGTENLPEALSELSGRAICIVLGAEGPGLRDRTRDTCDRILRIPFAADFGSLNVSNAAAVALYAASQV